MRKNELDNELGLTDDDIATLRMIREGKIPNPDRSLPNAEQRVLIVESHYLILSNSVQSSESQVTKSESAIVLKGKASHGTNDPLKRAFITIIEDCEKVKAPEYIKDKASIFLWIHHRNLETLLTQMRAPKVYCHIRYSEGGHVHGDIHTGRIEISPS